MENQSNELSKKSNISRLFNETPKLKKLRNETGRKTDLYRQAYGKRSIRGFLTKKQRHPVVHEVVGGHDRNNKKKMNDKSISLSGGWSIMKRHKKESEEDENETFKKECSKELAKRYKDGGFGVHAKTNHSFANGADHHHVTRRARDHLSVGGQPSLAVNIDVRSSPEKADEIVKEYNSCPMPATYHASPTSALGLERNCNIYLGETSSNIVKASDSNLFSPKQTESGDSLSLSKFSSGEDKLFTCLSSGLKFLENVDPSGSEVRTNEESANIRVKLEVFSHDTSEDSYQSNIEVAAVISDNEMSAEQHLGQVFGNLRSYLLHKLNHVISSAKIISTGNSSSLSHSGVSDTFRNKSFPKYKNAETSQMSNESWKSSSLTSGPDIFGTNSPVSCQNKACNKIYADAGVNKSPVGAASYSGCLVQGDCTNIRSNSTNYNHKVMDFSHPNTSAIKEVPGDEKERSSTLESLDHTNKCGHVFAGEITFKNDNSVMKKGKSISEYQTKNTPSRVNESDNYSIDKGEENKSADLGHSLCRYDDALYPYTEFSKRVDDKRDWFSSKCPSVSFDRCTPGQNPDLRECIKSVNEGKAAERSADGRGIFRSDLDLVSSAFQWQDLKLEKGLLNRQPGSVRVDIGTGHVNISSAEKYMSNEHSRKGEVKSRGQQGQKCLVRCQPRSVKERDISHLVFYFDHSKHLHLHENVTEQVSEKVKDSFEPQKNGSNHDLKRSHFHGRFVENDAVHDEQQRGGFPEVDFNCSRGFQNQYLPEFCKFTEVGNISCPQQRLKCPGDEHVDSGLPEPSRLQSECDKCSENLISCDHTLGTTDWRSSKNSPTFCHSKSKVNAGMADSSGEYPVYSRSQYCLCRPCGCRQCSYQEAAKLRDCRQYNNQEGRLLQTNKGHIEVNREQTLEPSASKSHQRCSPECLPPKFHRSDNNCQNTRNFGQCIGSSYHSQIHLDLFPRGSDLVYQNMHSDKRSPEDVREQRTDSVLEHFITSLDYEESSERRPRKDACNYVKENGASRAVNCLGYHASRDTASTFSAHLHRTRSLCGNICQAHPHSHPGFHPQSTSNHHRSISCSIHHDGYQSGLQEFSPRLWHSRSHVPDGLTKLQNDEGQNSCFRDVRLAQTSRELLRRTSRDNKSTGAAIRENVNNVSAVRPRASVHSSLCACVRRPSSFREEYPPQTKLSISESEAGVREDKTPISPQENSLLTPKIQSSDTRKSSPVFPSSPSTASCHCGTKNFNLSLNYIPLEYGTRFPCSKSQNSQDKCLLCDAYNNSERKSMICSCQKTSRNSCHTRASPHRRPNRDSRAEPSTSLSSATLLGGAWCSVRGGRALDYLIFNHAERGVHQKSNAPYCNNNTTVCNSVSSVSQAAAINVKYAAVCASSFKYEELNPQISAPKWCSRSGPAVICSFVDQLESSVSTCRNTEKLCTLTESSLRVAEQRQCYDHFKLDNLFTGKDSFPESFQENVGEEDKADEFTSCETDVRLAGNRPGCTKELADFGNCLCRNEVHGVTSAHCGRRFDEVCTRQIFRTLQTDNEPKNKSALVHSSPQPKSCLIHGWKKNQGSSSLARHPAKQVSFSETSVTFPCLPSLTSSADITASASTTSHQRSSLSSNHCSPAPKSHRKIQVPATNPLFEERSSPSSEYSPLLPRTENKMDGRGIEIIVSDENNSHVSTVHSGKRAVLRRIWMILQDNRVAGRPDSENALRPHPEEHVVLKRVLNIIFVTVGVALLLSVFVVIIYTHVVEDDHWKKDKEMPPPLLHGQTFSGRWTRNIEKQFSKIETSSFFPSLRT